MSSRPIEFSSKELMIEYANKLASKKFNFDLGNILRQSILLRNVKEQLKLVRFLQKTHRNL